MKKIFTLFIIVLLITSCFDEEPKYYNSLFFPVKEGLYKNHWIKNEYFYDSIPITIKLESRINYKSLLKEGRFDSINIHNAQLYLNRDIYFLNDTLLHFSNLLNTEHAEIETIMTARSGGFIPDYYIVWINKNLSFDYEKNKGYLTIYFKTKTQYNHIINDSTVIYIGK